MDLILGVVIGFFAANAVGSLGLGSLSGAFAQSRQQAITQKRQQEILEQRKTDGQNKPS